MVGIDSVYNAYYNINRILNEHVHRRNKFMNNQLAQVIRIDQCQEETVWGNIEAWLQKCEKKSENTAKTYNKAVRDYFFWLCKKRLEDLEPKDLIASGTLLVKYQNLLKEKNKNSTVNTKMAAIRSVYKFIEEDYAGVKSEWFNKIDRFDEDEDGEGYGELFQDEIIQMMEYASQEPCKGLEKSLLIEMAVTTSFRKSSLLSLKWSDIKYNEKENLYIISTYLKRKKDSKPITPDQYERLLQLKETNKDYIFTLSTSTIQKFMDRLCKNIIADDTRNITFHSYKNVAINFACRVMKDMHAAKTQGNHSSMQTTEDCYIKANREFSNMPGLKMWQDCDLSKLDELSKEELVKIIKSCSEWTSREIISKIDS